MLINISKLPNIFFHVKFELNFVHSRVPCYRICKLYCGKENIFKQHKISNSKLKITQEKKN